MIMESCPESAPEPYQNVGIPTRLLEELENCSSNPYVFVVFSDAFWPTFRFLGQKSAPGSNTLNPVRTCRLRIYVFLGKSPPKSINIP